MIITIIHNILYYAHTTWRKRIMNENKMMFYRGRLYFIPKRKYYYAIIVCTNTINKSRNVNLGL